MSASAIRHQSNIYTGPGKALNLILWGVQVMLALAFLAPSSLKLMGAPVMVELFEAVEFGQWLRYVTGILELTGVVFIVVPKTKSVGAVLICHRNARRNRRAPLYLAYCSDDAGRESPPFKRGRVGTAAGTRALCSGLDRHQMNGIESVLDHSKPASRHQHPVLDNKGCVLSA